MAKRWIGDPGGQAVASFAQQCYSALLDCLTGMETMSRQDSTSFGGASLVFIGKVFRRWMTKRKDLTFWNESLTPGIGACADLFPTGSGRIARAESKASRLGKASPRYFLEIWKSCDEESVKFAFNNQMPCLPEFR